VLARDIELITIYAQLKILASLFACSPSRSKGSTDRGVDLFACFVQAHDGDHAASASDCPDWSGGLCPKIL